jgi:hypothetical protein
VISFSRTWPLRIALSGSSLPVKARKARLVTSVTAKGRATDGNTEGRQLRKKRRPFPLRQSYLVPDLLGNGEALDILRDLEEGLIKFVAR